MVTETDDLRRIVCLVSRKVGFREETVSSFPLIRRVRFPLLLVHIRCPCSCSLFVFSVLVVFGFQL